MYDCHRKRIRAEGSVLAIWEAVCVHDLGALAAVSQRQFFGSVLAILEAVCVHDLGALAAVPQRRFFGHPIAE